MMHTENTVPEALQPQALLMPPKALAQHLRTLIDNDPSMEKLTFINSCLLDQIRTEAIPSSIFHIWLFLACQHSRHFVAAALQDSSCGVRKAGIRVAWHRLFRGPHWKVHGWDALGGAEGMKDILVGLPLAEVQLLIKAIPAHSGSFGDRQVVMKCLEDFLVLVESINAWTMRSLSHHVSVLYAYCTAEKVNELLRSQKPIPSVIFTHLGQFHTPLLRRIAIGATKMPPDVRQNVLKLCRNSLLRSEEAYAPIHHNETQSNLTPGLLFGLDLLLVMAKEPVLESDYGIHNWIESVLGQAIRNKLPLPSILPILNASLALCRSTHPSNWLSQSLPKDVIQFWSIARFGRVGGYPNGLAKKFQRRPRSEFMEAHNLALEQCLIQRVLQIKDDELTIRPRRAVFTRAITNLLSLVAMKGRLEFLQLLCQHAPTLDFDLTAWPPTEKERQLLPVWDYDVLRMLSPESSKLLFKRSLYLYRCDEFLPSSDAGKQHALAPSWEDQCLLWVSWEFSVVKGNDDFPVTRKAIDQMKQRATQGREPAERLHWAKSVITLAGKAQSVDIFGDSVKWSKRFLRDPLVFPDLIDRLLCEAGRTISCKADLQATRTASKSHLLKLVQRGHEILTDLLEISLLLLREPWARNSVGRMTRPVRNMLSVIVDDRLDGVRNHAHVDSTTESELVKILLDPLIPIFIDFEREGNAEGQTDVGWSGPSCLVASLSCPDLPSPAELSFMDRLANSRNEFWQQHRARTNPDVLSLGAGWPRGLPIQDLVGDELWLYHAINRPHDAPYLSSRVNEVLLGSLDTIMAVVPENTGPIDHFVDSLWSAISALIADGEQADRVRNVLRIWEYYSSELQLRPLYLKLFQDWLSEHVRDGDAPEAADIIQPAFPVKPTISSVPTGSEVIEWDPQNGDDDTAEVTSRNDHGKPTEVPCTLLNCRMEGRIPVNTRSITIRLPPIPKPLSIWSFAGNSPQAENQDASAHVQDSIVLSALLFLDTYTKGPRILRIPFPDVKHPRYTPIYLADEFIARVTNGKPKDALRQPVTALRKCVKRVPSRILRDLIWSFIDTLKAEPNMSIYSDLLFCTFDLIKILLSSDQPQLVVDVVLRVCKQFAHESSNHRKISLVKLGRILRPEEASEMMQRFGKYVCDALETQQQQQEASGVVIKVTTAKMLADEQSGWR